MDPFDLSDPEFQKFMKQADLMADLMEEYTNSPELTLVTRVRTFNMSIKIFERNYDALVAGIDNLQPRNDATVLRWVMDITYRQDRDDEISRILHNFVASASSLIDHARVFFRDMYEPENLMPEYSEKIDYIFIHDGLSQFIVKLRQYCQHYQTPPLTTSVAINNVDNKISGGVTISRQMLLRYSGWNSQAKAFISAASDQIDLAGVCTEYHAKVRSFYDWFRSEQAKIHKDAFEYVRRVEQRLGPDSQLCVAEVIDVKSANPEQLP